MWAEKAKKKIEEVLKELKKEHPKLKLAKRDLVKYIWEYISILNPYMISYHKDDRYKIVYEKLNNIKKDEFIMRLLSK